MAKIKEILLFRCRAEKGASEDDTLLMPEVNHLEGKKIFQAFEWFSQQNIRHKMVIVLDNGVEIGIMPTLSRSRIARMKASCSGSSSSFDPEIWDVKVDLRM
ncbi:MAG: hypothetical protein KGI50_04990 [Patescibacteria group bacterium]|nr:hypothetical protein [Patescibacteria group bacterium]MDE2438604.1 hypothetical protein [Patescibacteria group bacterium]